MDYTFSAFDPEFLETLKDFENLFNLFQQILLKTNGDVERALEVMKSLQANGYLPEDWDLDEFAERLENEEIITRTPKGRELTAKGERGIRRSSLEAIFGGLQLGLMGNHPTPHGGAGGIEDLPERRPYEFGDDFAKIDFGESIMNSVRRTGSTCKTFAA